MVPDTRWLLVYRPVSLVFKTVHFDKAGETSDFRIIEAEVADIDDDASALLVTRDGIPITVPESMLFPVHPLGTPPESQSYIAGHELIRDFHPSAGSPRTSLRWLDRPEVEELISEGRQA